MEGKESFDQSRQIRQTEITEGDLVLRHDSVAEIDMSRSRRLSYKWLGPYRVQKAIPDKGTYILEEFDGTKLAGTYSGNRLKKFVVRNRFYIPVAAKSEDGEGSESSNSLEEAESGENEDEGSKGVDEGLGESTESKPETLGRGLRVRRAKRFFDELG